MNAADFTRRWMGLIALLAGLVAVFPWLLHAVVQNSQCDVPSGGCGRMVEVLGHYGNWVVIGVVLIPLIFAIAGRTLTVGTFVWAFPFALLMIAGSLPLLLVLGNLWMPDFADQALAMPARTPLLFLGVLMVALSVQDDEDSGSGQFWRWALGLVAAGTVFVTANAWLIGLATLPWIGAFAHPLGGLIARAHAALGIGEELARLTYFCLLAFMITAAGLVVASRAQRHVPVRRLSRA